MKRTVTYNKFSGSPVTVEYDDEAPCECCGEPVISASMGGTKLCPWCDMGKCRYCGVNTVVLREEIDGGASKKNLLEHMAWHRAREPNRNAELLAVHRKMEEDLKKNGT